MNSTNRSRNYFSRLKHWRPRSADMSFQFFSDQVDNDDNVSDKAQNDENDNDRQCRQRRRRRCRRRQRRRRRWHLNYRRRLPNISRSRNSTSTVNRRNLGSDLKCIQQIKLLPRLNSFNSNLTITAHSKWSHQRDKGHVSNKHAWLKRALVAQCCNLTHEALLCGWMEHGV